MYGDELSDEGLGLVVRGGARGCRVSVWETSRSIIDTVFGDNPAGMQLSCPCPLIKHSRGKLDDIIRNPTHHGQTNEPYL